MRLAVIVAPPHFALPHKGSVFAAAEPIGPLCAALARGQRRLLLVETTAALASAFEDALRHVTADDDLIVYVASRTVAGASVSLRTGDGANSTVPLRALGDAVRACRAAPVLIIVDLRHDGADDPMVSAEHVDAVLTDLDARAQGYGVLAAAVPDSRPNAAEWPFSRHLVAVLEDPSARDERGELQLEPLYGRLRSRETFEADVQSFAFVRTATAFTLVDSPAVSDIAPRPAAPLPSPLVPVEPMLGAWSDGDDAIAEEWPDPFAPVGSPTEPAPPPPSVAVAEASPAPPEPQPSTPDVAELLALADGARDRAAWSQALAGYQAALLLGRDAGTEQRAEMRARIAAAKRALGLPSDVDRDPNLAAPAPAEATATGGAHADADPADDAAFEVTAASLAARGEWALLDLAYMRRVDRLAVLGDAERAWDANAKLGALRRDELGDAPGALDAFREAARYKPNDAGTSVLVADALLAVGDEAACIAELERAARLQPAHAPAYTRLFRVHGRAVRTDRAWLAACALEELGEADLDVQVFVDQYRQDGPVRPVRALDDATWSSLLRAPGADDVVSGIVRAVAPAAIASRVDELRQSHKLPALDPARRQSAASTVTAVRSFQWAAQVLGVEVPELYVLDDVPGGIAAVPAAVPTTALGPSVLRGLTAKELAFLSARHLAYYRPEHAVLVHYPTLEALSVLFLAAVCVAMPEVPVPARWRDGVARTAKAVARYLTDGDQRRLASAVARLHERNGQADLGAWIRSVELTAQRAGLLLCGDLAAAGSLVRAEAGTRAIAELTYDEKRGDLLVFCASDKLSQARAWLGVDAHRSVSDRPEAAMQAG